MYGKGLRVWFPSDIFDKLAGLYRIAASIYAAGDTPPEYFAGCVAMIHAVAASFGVDDPTIDEAAGETVVDGHGGAR